MNESAKASSGLATFIMIFVRGRPSSFRSVRSTSKRQFAFVNEADVAFRAGNRDDLAVLQRFRAVFRPDDCRHAELATDDRRVTGAAAAIGHDRGRLFHDRLPIRIGLVGDQNFALLKFDRGCSRS